MSFNVLFWVFVISAGIYGWGMRGTVIGGEKGAMLPGVFLGAILALFSGGSFFEYFYIPAAAGLMGMSFGGIEPYGDTIGFVIHSNGDKSKIKKGVIGLSLKGALWFSVCGGIIGKSFSAMGGKYSVLHIVLFCVLCPVFQFLFYKIFNTPYDKNKDKFPKIYFCEESREEWGSNVGIVVALLISAVLVKDVLSVVMLVFGFVFGWIGWSVAIFLYYRDEIPMKNGKYLFGNLKDYIGGWKLMEFSLGGIGCFGIALGFILNKGYVSRLNNDITVNGLFSPLAGYETLITIVMAVVFLLLLAVNIFDFVCDEKGKEYNSFVMDCIERPLFNVIPLAFVLLCSLKASSLMTVFMLVYVCSLKVCFDRFKKDEHRKLFFVIYFGLSSAVFVLDIIVGSFSPVVLFFVGGLPYIITELLFIVFGRKIPFSAFIKDLKKSGELWFMFILSTVLTVLSVVVFK